MKKELENEVTQETVLNEELTNGGQPVSENEELSEQVDTNIKLFRRNWTSKTTGTKGSNYYVCAKHPVLEDKHFHCEFKCDTEGVAGFRAMADIFDLDPNPVLTLVSKKQRDKITKRVTGEYVTYSIAAIEKIGDVEVRHMLKVKPATAVDESNLQVIMAYMKIDPTVLLSAFPVGYSA